MFPFYLPYRQTIRIFRDTCSPKRGLFKGIFYLTVGTKVMHFIRRFLAINVAKTDKTVQDQIYERTILSQFRIVWRGMVQLSHCQCHDSVPIVDFLVPLYFPLSRECGKGGKSCHYPEKCVLQGWLELFLTNKSWVHTCISFDTMYSCKEPGSMIQHLIACVTLD